MRPTRFGISALLTHCSHLSVHSMQLIHFTSMLAVEGPGPRSGAFAEAHFPLPT